MAEVVHDPTINLPGPWLLTKDALLNLDRVMDEVWDMLDKRNKANLKNAIAKELRKLHDRRGFDQLPPENRKAEEERTKDFVKSLSQFEPGEKPTLLLTFKDEKKLLFDSFAEVFANADMRDKSVKEFELKAAYAGVSIKISCTQTFSDNMHIWVFPANLPIAAEVSAKFVAWAEDRKPGWVLYILSTSIFIRWMIVYAVLAITFIVVSVVQSQGTAQLKAEAHKLLHSGIKPEDQPRAIRLLLALQSGYTGDPEPSIIPPWYVWFAGCLIGVALLLSYPLRTAVAVGKGATSVKWSLNWIWFVTKAVPYFILTAIILKLLSSFVTDHLKWW